MSGWARKRFWKATEARETPEGWEVRLDGRPLRTPAKAPLVVPTPALARMIATEWDAQEGTIRPDTMPATRMANSALDKVRPQREAVVEIVAAYGESDLLCYRAEGPAELVALQAAEWDPLLDWASARFDVSWRKVAGVMPRPQPEGTLARLRAQVAALDSFRLAAVHDLVALSGSLVIGLAVLEGHDPQALWHLSRLDEDWQARQWGEDHEAAVAAARKQEAFAKAADFLGACT